MGKVTPDSGATPAFIPDNAARQSTPHEAASFSDLRNTVKLARPPDDAFSRKTLCQKRHSTLKTGDICCARLFAARRRPASDVGGCAGVFGVQAGYNRHNMNV